MGRNHDKYLTYNDREEAGRAASAWSCATPAAGRRGRL